jgi:hypothetical protein
VSFPRRVDSSVFKKGVWSKEGVQVSALSKVRYVAINQ